MQSDNIVKRIEILDALRGLAALVVVVHHLFSIEYRTIQASCPNAIFKVLEVISNQNHNAVLFFFVLSGFSISLSLKNKNILDRDTLNQYFYRRFRRILPIYWTALILSFVAALFCKDVPEGYYSWKSLLGNMLFLQTAVNTPPFWFPPFAGNGPLWSLAYEMFFYLIFPLVYFIKHRYLKRIPEPYFLATLMLVSISALILNKLFFVPYLIFSVYFVIWYIGFLLGNYFQNRQNQDKTFATLALFIVCFYFLLHRFHSDTLISVKDGLIITILFYFFIRLNSLKFFVKLIEKGMLRIFRTAGAGSYAIYVFHYPLLHTLHEYRINISVQVIVLILFVFLCKYVEERSIKYKYSWLKMDYASLLRNKLLRRDMA